MVIWILLILLILFAFSGPWYPYSRGWGYGPSGLLMIILVVLLILYLLGRL